MTFIQIVSFRTDRYTEFAPLEAEWEAATEGRRTLLGSRELRDRHDSRHYVHVEEFATYESAMANSGLPETDGLAKTLTELCDGPAEFGDFDLLAEHDERVRVADRLRASLEDSSAPQQLYVDDVAFVGEFPNQVVQVTGSAAMAELLVAEAPGRTIERWDVTPTATGFVAEYAYRTLGADSRYSRGVALATLTAGRISRLLFTCAGAWTSAEEREIRGLAAV